MIFKELKSAGVRPNKLLGQNFLIDKKILQKIVQASQLKKGDRAVEIGAGTGVLTAVLLKTRVKVIAFEKDKNLADFLAKKFSQETKSGQLMLKIGDFLKADLTMKKPYKLVANIPYYLTGRLLRFLIDAPKKPKSAILMLQKEVAERILAKPPKASLLSNLVNLCGQAEKIISVPPMAFYPKPKVDSAIVKIKFRQKPINKDLVKVIKIGFCHPRKTLLNNLLALAAKEKILKIFNVLKIPLTRRPAEITLRHWSRLTQLIV